MKSSDVQCNIIEIFQKYPIWSWREFDYNFGYCTVSLENNGNPCSRGASIASWKSETQSSGAEQRSQGSDNGEAEFCVSSDADSKLVMRSWLYASQLDELVSLARLFVINRLVRSH